ncbi:hypothetical protein FK268_04225 [Tsukamurella sputi]|uniref:Prokaryotic cytochrome C oxidase subunit IV family protein n=1 Tax=Tsukamurella sputi TaxID=2591848 RepID=A0A5C5RW73_9ACTN|nr:cytochrome C oxidase subunit IV family protein [Tsukamurella sputi]TWS26445.1 hypothetical protein FK268_04225 [Tsukamurella sputi]
MTATAATVHQAPLIRQPYFWVWLGLIAVTGVSYWLGSGHGMASPEAANAVILVVAFVKVRFIGIHFMDLKDAPWALRSIFEAFCVIVCAALIAILTV